jgi:hypothetical protein
MAIEITPEDFVNKFEIHTNGYNLAKLTSYIERYSESYLIDLFGVELYNLFIAGYEDEAIYIYLYEPFNYQLDECFDYKILKSRGIFDMLLGFIYCHYLEDINVQQTINNPVKIKGQNSERANKFDANFYGRWNESVQTYQAIQRYCLDKESVYPTFKGVKKDLIYLAW